MAVKAPAELQCCLPESCVQAQLLLSRWRAAWAVVKAVGWRLAACCLPVSALGQEGLPGPAPAGVATGCFCMGVAGITRAGRELRDNMCRQCWGRELGLGHKSKTLQ
jgi:hypothetical protein